MSLVRSPILLAEDRYPTHPISGPQAYVDEWWEHFQGNVPVPEGVAVGRVVIPFVNHGRWIILCPSPNCGSAQWASKRDPRFLCVECANREVGNVWLPVDWPAETDEVERLLGARPDRHTRSWNPGEPVENLRQENALAGIR